MIDIPPFSPGCFGSALTFKKDDMVCGSCQFKTKCEPAHEEAKLALRERYGIKTTQQVVTAKAEAAKAKKEAEREALDPAALELPKKTQELLLKLDRGNYNVIANLQMGVNPFGAAMPYMALTCKLLIAFRDRATITQENLSAAFVKTFSWKQDTATAHARMAIQALNHLGLLSNNNGNISLRRA